MVYKPIESYGVIGDLHTVALVGVDGSIDWCCLPHFDSPSVFGAILDEQKGGFFKIASLYKAQHRQMYLPDSNVLVTRFLSADGVEARASDTRRPAWRPGSDHDRCQCGRRAAAKMEERTVGADRHSGTVTLNHSRCHSLGQNSALTRLGQQRRLGRTWTSNAISDGPCIKNFERVR